MLKKHVWECVRSAVSVAVLGLSMAGGALASLEIPASRFTALSDNTSPKAGESFTLWWVDETLPLGGATSYTDGDVWVAYDASLLTLTAFGVGSIFNGATATLVDDTYQSAQYSWLGSLTLRPFLIAGGDADGGATDQGVVAATFAIAQSAPTTDTIIYFLPDQIAVQNDFGATPSYYAFGDPNGYGASISITAIPEPASVALLLGGSRRGGWRCGAPQPQHGPHGLTGFATGLQHGLDRPDLMTTHRHAFRRREHPTVLG